MVAPLCERSHGRGVFMRPLPDVRIEGLPLTRDRSHPAMAPVIPRSFEIGVAAMSLSAHRERTAPLDSTLV